MRILRRVRAVHPGVVLTLLFGLLVLLGALQYRWSGELSEAERVRMRAGAQTRADAFAREFDREITRAFLRLGLDAESHAAGRFASYAQRHERWRRTAAHPGLVADVFLADADGRLRRFHSGTFADATWPAAWAPLRERAAHPFAGAFRDGHDERLGPVAFLPDGAPLLLLPVVPTDPLRLRPARAGPGAWPGSFASVLVRLDLAYARDRLLPTLAQRHFGGTEGLEYTLSVVRADQPSLVVWQTAPAGGRADASAGLLDLRPEEADDEDLRQLLGPRAAASAGPPAPEARGAAWTFSRRLDGPRDRTLRAPRRGRWQVQATHRAGSLDAAVSAARRRNLTASFGILVLLGASSGFLVTSARRASHLAQRQIEFVAGVTHELRTPLAVIRSAGENLADGVIAEPSEVRAYGELVRDEGRRLTEMVEQALELAGAESGRMAATREPLSVRMLLEDALREWRAHESVRGVHTDAEVASDLPPVLGDPAALRRVLRNLLDNAVKHGGERHWVGVRASATGREVAVTVEDQGPGIPADEREHVFEPFYRGRHARAQRIRGSGLGLSLVHRIVESHGGNVRIEDGRGGGTAFTVTLPALTGPAS